jgi:hypothetical protein
VDGQASTLFSTAYFLLTTAAEPVLGPTQFHMKWVMKTFPDGKAAEADLHFCQRKKMREAYLHVPHTPLLRGA